jgi:hypothetical protein
MPSAILDTISHLVLHCPMLAAYKIRNSDGLYATAGFHYWTKRGKTWSMLGHITQALSVWKEYNKIPVPEHWTIVELTPSGIREFSACDYYAERLAARR